MGGGGAGGRAGGAQGHDGGAARGVHLAHRRQQDLGELEGGQQTEGRLNNLKPNHAIYPFFNCMIGSEFTAMLRGEWQMGRFCLVVKLPRRGHVTNGATRLVFTTL